MNTKLMAMLVLFVLPSSFPDATEVLYRCSTLKVKSKNRWKLTCEDGSWIGSTNLTCGIYLHKAMDGDVL